VRDFHSSFVAFLRYPTHFGHLTKPPFTTISIVFNGLPPPNFGATSALLKGRFARQKVSVKLEHYWELEYVRTRFTEFKRRVEDLEEAHDGELDRFQESVEIAWKDLIHAMETLLAALP
jgi:hypothetical protein